MFIEIFIKKLIKIFFIFNFNFIFNIRNNNLFTIRIQNHNIYNYIYILKNLRIFQLKVIIDLLGIDWLTFNNNNIFNRFTLIYNFLSIRKFYRIFFDFKIIDNLNPVFYSITNLYQGINWLERENWDLFGIFFLNNYDLRRILTDYGFEGFPLRKDYPLSGFIELRYDDFKKMIISENLELSQEFRFFDFESPWL